MAFSSLIGVAGGIVEAGGYAVSEHVAANLTVNCGAGKAWVPGTSTAAQSQYFVYNDATVNLAISAPSATNPRIDKVVLRVKDESVAGTGNEALLEVVTGTAEAGATLANKKGAGATPASSLVLAYVLVPALASSIVGGNIENVVSTAIASPLLPVPTQRTVGGGPFRLILGTVNTTTAAIVNGGSGGWTPALTGETGVVQIGFPVAAPTAIVPVATPSVAKMTANVSEITPAHFKINTFIGSTGVATTDPQTSFVCLYF